MHTRKFLFASLALIAVLVLAESAAAQVYPSRPVRIFVGFPPGGTSDVVARFMGQCLSERLGQPFIIENRPGAAANIAMEAAARAPADGYTLVTISSTNTVNATLYEKLSFNFVRDIAPVAAIIRVPIVLEVNPSVPAKTVPDLITYAKANAGKLSLASPGNGTPAHVAGELFKMTTGINMIHVPYRGGAPAGIIDKLYNEINAALVDPRMKARLTDLGATVLLLSPADLRTQVAQDIEKWGKAIRAARIKPD
jgi:tripartite-type tricarboxylate transporter receptor subunit TctC